MVKTVVEISVVTVVHIKFVNQRGVVVYAAGGVNFHKIALFFCQGYWRGRKEIRSTAYAFLRTFDEIHCEERLRFLELLSPDPVWPVVRISFTNAFPLSFKASFGFFP